MHLNCCPLLDSAVVDIVAHIFPDNLVLYIERYHTPDQAQISHIVRISGSESLQSEKSGIRKPRWELSPNSWVRLNPRSSKSNKILTSKYNKPFPVTLLPSAIGYYLGVKQGERQAQILNEIQALDTRDHKKRYIANSGTAMQEFARSYTFLDWHFGLVQIKHRTSLESSQLIKPAKLIPSGAYEYSLLFF
ncbi:uncharacterized protein MYCFIDRAFT_174129 [Pseudocercospora fijiensis CIRAD86]|uniref:Uncharacterized protein n=1 Tax=Pseudocercospora fijiensis (strain CIRAD86) TaxID=383855 RepID=M3AZG7_PSEFD|nr:uncharacterized protein MYCFIDRAFT_174129 [Pseudocercospora fijiensis CIRAD86]EME82568.1 hypothetical protein MYCFIDRAFT_174129 [Pseudocercospora fijiensis CIRAD86]